MVKAPSPSGPRWRCALCMRSRSARSPAASPSARQMALMPHMAGAATPQYRHHQTRGHAKPADGTRNPDCEGWTPLERETHQRLGSARYDLPVGPNRCRADCVPFIAGCKRFDLAHNCRTIDWRITKPVAVPLGQQKMSSGPALPFINDPMGHQAAAGKKGDDLSNTPHVV